MFLTAAHIRKLRLKVLSKEIFLLTFDLETSISKFYGFSGGEMYVDPSSLVPGTETKVLTAQYIKGIGKKAKYIKADVKIHKCADKKCKQIHHVEIDDTKLLREFIPIVNAADLVIGQNSKSFDEKTIRERCKVLKIPPIRIDLMIDMLPASKRSFRSISHRLDFRSKQQGLGGKIVMTREDWTDIDQGKVSLHKKMIPYGLKDAEDTIKLFFLELPYYDLTQAMYNKIIALIEDPKGFCIFCQLDHRKATNVVLKKPKTKLPYFHCKECGNEWDYDPELHKSKLAK